jgi:hypothetical protein
MLLGFLLRSNLDDVTIPHGAATTFPVFTVVTQGAADSLVLSIHNGRSECRRPRKWMFSKCSLDKLLGFGVNCTRVQQGQLQLATNERDMLIPPHIASQHTHNVGSQIIAPETSGRI